MTDWTLSVIVINLILALGVGIFSWILRHEVYKVAHTFRVHLPRPLRKFLRVTIMLPLFLLVGILTFMLISIIFS